MSPSRPARRAAVLATGLTVAVASGASAHPAFDPDQVPGGEPIESTLVIPHGCGADGGMPGEGGGDPTTLIELQLTDAFATFEAADVDGWDVSRDGDVVSWRDAGGATADPIELPVTFTVAGEADEELYLSLYQACDAGGEFRWIGTPDRQADFPAVKLTLTSGGTGTETIAAGGQTTDGTSEMASEAATAPATDPARDPRVGESSSEMAAADGSAGGLPAGPFAVAAVAALAALGATLALRRRDPT